MFTIKEKLFSFIILSIYGITCFSIYQLCPVETRDISKQNTPLYTSFNEEVEVFEDNDIILFLEIERLNLIRPVFPLDHVKNNVDENVTLLAGSVPSDAGYEILLLAAHSGDDIVAYFNELNQLQIGDILKIHTNDSTFIYLINEIWEEDRNGFIHVKKYLNKQLILTTCSTDNDNMQLVISALEKE